MVVFNLGGQLLTNFAGFIIPGYYSLGALFTHNKEDDTQWLTVSTDTGSNSSHFSPRTFADNSTVLGGVRLLHRCRELHQHCLLVPLLLRLQVHLPSVARPPHVPVSDHMHFASFRKEDGLTSDSGADLIFRSFMVPAFGRYFEAPPAAARKAD